MVATHGLLWSFPTPTKFSWEAKKRAKEIKEPHTQVRERTERTNSQVMQQVTKHKEVHFQPGDLVWIHMRKEKFPSKRKSNIMPRPDGPFEILEQIGLNAYKVLEIMGPLLLSMWLILGLTLMKRKEFRV